MSTMRSMKPGSTGSWVSNRRSYRRTGLFHKFVRRTAATRPMALLYGLTQEPIDRFVYRVSGGRGTASSWLGGTGGSRY